MAEIRRVTRRNPISQFRNVAPEGGGTFRVLAEAANAAYERLAPAAIEQMEAEGTEHGRELARRHMGDNRAISLSTMGQPSAPGGRMGQYRDAIASIESRGSGDYAAIGPRHARLGRALGRYQIMEANIGPWSREALGREVSADEFLRRPRIQDAIFDHKFGSYVSRFGEEGAAQAWFAGPGGVGKLDRTDVLGTDVGSYGQRFLQALGGERVSAMDGPAPPAVTVRTSENKIEARLYSPMAGPILQAHNAAAQVAYVSEMMNQGALDLFELSSQHPLDPEGFDQAATAYIEGIVENAPEPFQADLQSTLERAAQQRFLGMVEERHRDIRTRANNSSRALMERWSDNYAEALAAGDEDASLAALTELNSVLTARESLPGVAWTPEQSENIRLAAQDQAARIVRQNRQAVSDEIKGKLRTIIAAAEDGLTAADEAILADPATMELHPELFAEAAGKVALRDGLPHLNAAPTDARQAAVDDLASVPISDDFQIDIIDAARQQHERVTEAFEDSPIDAAQTYHRDNPPPELPDLTTDDPSAFVEGLTARREYGRALVEGGFTETLAFFTDTEAESLGAMLGRQTPPEIRAAMAGAIVAGFGDDAGQAFQELKITDPVIRHAGMMMARGGNSSLAAEALRGQAMLDEGVVQVPSSARRLSALTPEINIALSGLTVDTTKIEKDVIEFATALYAARSRGIAADSEEAADLMGQAVQEALGQSTNRRGQVTGGVQTVGDQPVLLPVGVSGEALEKAMAAALAPQMAEGVLGAIRDTAAAISGGSILPASEPWIEASRTGDYDGGVPTLFGEPISFRLWQNGNLRLVPLSGNTYRIDFVNGSSIAPVLDADGRLYSFDITVLQRSMQ